MATGLRQACWKGVGSFTNWKELGYTATAKAYQDVYYVDGTYGSDANEGTSWERAFATIDYACGVAGYSHGTSAVSYTDKRKRTAVFIAPGHYNEGPLFTTYNTDIIGCIGGVPGKDYGVSINYDGAVTSTAVFGIMGSGNVVANLHFYCDFAGPAVYMANGDNNLFTNCVVEGDGTNMTYGFQMAGMKGCWIRDCVVEGAVTAGIYVAGGTDKYAIDGGIENCQIHTNATGAHGISVAGAGTLVASRSFRINHNFLDVIGGGATSYGIYQQNTGTILLTDNYILCHTTAITKSANGSIGNHVSASGTIADPYDDD